MAKKKQKYYVVWQGVHPGIYHSWTDCQLQIKGYPDAKYKSFYSLKEAQEAFEENYATHIGGVKQNVQKSSKPSVPRSQIIWESISVDAACSGSPGIMEYRGVWTKDTTPIFHQGPFRWATNNVGEFLALVHALAWVKQQDLNQLVIYSDSRTAMAWLRNKKIKTTLKRTSSNEDVFKLLERAHKWIQQNTWTNPVLKWETASWGEIPADFGRK